MRKINRGFTLVELLVVLSIIGVLAGLLYLLVAPSEDMAKKKACEANRNMIILALENYRYTSGLSKEACTLENFINDGYKGTLSTENAKCPSGGIYTAGTDENGREIVLCSIHSVTSGGGDTPGGGLPAGSFYIPGTGDTIVGSSDWTAPGIVKVTDPGKTWAGTYVNFNKNDKFTYEINGEDEYYIAVTNSGVDNIYVAGDHPDLTPDGLPASAYSYGYGLVKFTGVSKNWEDILNGDKFYRGDIIYYNGDYYVLMNALGVAYTITKGQYWSNSPDQDPNTWYKLSN